MAACPFLAGAAHRSGSQTLPSGQGGCPLGFSSSAKHDAQASSSTSETAACPYGFSASNVGPKLSSLHCTLCKQPLHDCCSCSPCGHKFCKFCISRTRDCPVCGQDIVGLAPDPTTQGLVDVFLAAHATGGGSLSSPQAGSFHAHLMHTCMHTCMRTCMQATSVGRNKSELQALWVAAGGAPLTAAADSQDSQLPLPTGQAEGQALPSAAAAFFLQLGLQAMRAGNPEAGLHRLEMCKAELISVAGQAAAASTLGSGSSSQSEPPQNHANVHAQHTAVGSMADSMKAKGGCPFHASNPGEAEPLAQQQQQQQQRQQQVSPPAACPFHTGSQAATPASASAPAAPSAPTPTSASAPAPSTTQANTTASAPAQPPAVDSTSTPTPTSAPGPASNPAPQPPSQAPTHPLRLAPPLSLPATLAAPLGAVFGAQGDASKALGLLGQAAALYAASVACTQAAANLEHPEATHVMTVSINKLGDCHFLGQALEVVACLIKVADASSAAADCLHLQPQPSTSTTASATTSWSAQGGAKQAGCPLHGQQQQQEQHEEEQQQERSREEQGGGQPEAQGCSGGAAAAAAAAAMSEAEGLAQALQLSCRSAAALEAAQQLLSQVDHLLAKYAIRRSGTGMQGTGSIVFMADTWAMGPWAWGHGEEEMLIEERLRGSLVLVCLTASRASLVPRRCPPPLPLCCACGLPSCSKPCAAWSASPQQPSAASDCGMTHRGWLDRNTNGWLDFQRIGESMQHPLELSSYEGLEALPPIGKEYQQRFKLVNDRLPKVRQQLHRDAEYRRGIDGRAHNNA
ncbi:hypothetical protein QJQ45_029472 [Haematococcus lacustris]|nr:hypothetical protein QJQ45_029472 [Haematococcus lacustris]